MTLLLSAVMLCLQPSLPCDLAPFPEGVASDYGYDPAATLCWETELGVQCEASPDPVCE